MAAEKSPRTKTQTLSLRLDPKTRFVLEFLAKINRQSITTIVEEAIRKAGTEGRLDPSDESSKTWRSFWDVSEGVRALRMLADHNVPSSYDDDELRAFLGAHIEFFSETNDLNDPDRINLHVLWPNISDYIDLWRETRRNEPFLVGREMVDVLRSAGVDPPEWPRKTKSPPKPPSKSRSSFPSELDEEIPF